MRLIAPNIRDWNEVSRPFSRAAAATTTAPAAGEMSSSATELMPRARSQIWGQRPLCAISSGGCREIHFKNGTYALNMLCSLIFHPSKLVADDDLATTEPGNLSDCFGRWRWRVNLAASSLAAA